MAPLLIYFLVGNQSPGKSIQDGLDAGRDFKLGEYTIEVTVHRANAYVQTGSDGFSIQSLGGQTKDFHFSLAKAGRSFLRV